MERERLCVRERDQIVLMQHATTIERLGGKREEGALAQLAQ
jgi:hypothetical protein